jgi:Resolvase, N terminal domain/Helix-turn-helix domain of resolvase
MAVLTLLQALDRSKAGEPIAPAVLKHLKRWSMPSSYFGAEWHSYYSAGVGQSRDSDCLEQSNFAVMLEALGGETETVVVVRERMADAWADTTTPQGRLMLTVLGGLAEFERELIKARTEEGRGRAQARGVRFGRKLKLSRHQILEALARREAGEALAEIGRSYNVSHSTISRL